MDFLGNTRKHPRKRPLLTSFLILLRIAFDVTNSSSFSDEEKAKVTLECQCFSQTEMDELSPKTRRAGKASQIRVGQQGSERGAYLTLVPNHSDFRAEGNQSKELPTFDYMRFKTSQSQGPD